MQQYSFLKIGFPERSNVVNWLSLHHNVSNTELCDTSNVVSKFSPHDSQFNDRLWDTSNEESEFLSHENPCQSLATRYVQSAQFIHGTIQFLQIRNSAEIQTLQFISTAIQIYQIPVPTDIQGFQPTARAFQRCRVWYFY